MYLRIGRYNITFFPPAVMRCWGYYQHYFAPFPKVSEFGLGPLLVVTWQ